MCTLEIKMSTGLTSSKDYAVLITCIGAAGIAYQIFKLWSSSKSKKSEWTPVGRVKHLYVYPIKSCKAKPVFSVYCDYVQGHSMENYDRNFLVTNSEGHFFTGRVKPQLLKVEAEISNDTLHLKYGDHAADISLQPIRERKQIIRTTLFEKKRQDGFDCGSEASEFFSKVVEEPARLVMFSPNLYTERIVDTEQTWWNNNQVPKRSDQAAFADLTPYMVTTQASLDDLNKRLEKPLTNVSFRANIIVEGCPAWDEDKWLELRFGDQPTNSATEMQCYRPCDRCIMTTIDPYTAERDPQEPLKTLRDFRMPTGQMAKAFKSPLFGVHSGMTRPGFVTVGQTVWARYKPNAF